MKHKYLITANIHKIQTQLNIINCSRPVWNWMWYHISNQVTVTFDCPSASPTLFCNAIQPLITPMRHFTDVNKNQPLANSHSITTEMTKQKKNGPTTQVRWPNNQSGTRYSWSRQWERCSHLQPSWLISTRWPMQYKLQRSLIKWNDRVLSTRRHDHIVTWVLECPSAPVFRKLGLKLGNQPQFKFNLEHDPF
jgi:hypothetical protein